jgi:SsrA-binding protein
MAENTYEKKIAYNRKARFDYFIMETHEAGIALVGTEVKALRAGKANLTDCFARIQNHEIIMMNLHISPYDKGNRYNHDPRRPRKLLLRKREITRLEVKVKERGLTLIPLRLYFKGNYAKVELALAKGKATYDKRESLRKKAAEQDMARDMRIR